MLTSGRFWIGVVAGVAVYHGYMMYRARQNS